MPFRTLVISHTDAAGTPYQTRVITDFPRALTDSYINHASALYEQLGMGVVSIVEVEETHHERLVGNTPVSVRKPTYRGFVGLARVLRPAFGMTAILAVTLATLALAVVGRVNDTQQAQKVSVGLKHIGVQAWEYTPNE
jgi:hypothetical protein